MTATTDDAAPGFSLDLFAKLTATLGTVADEVRAMRAEARALTQQPFVFSVVVSEPSPAANTNPFALLLGGPAIGFTWNVRNVVVSGATPVAVVAGRADLFVRSDSLDLPNLTAAAIGVTGWRDQATALPDVAFYSRDQVVVRANEQLWVVVQGAYTTNAVYVAQAEIEQIQDAPRLQVTQG